MSLPPQHSHHWDISAGGYEFGWGTSPDAAIGKEPTKHSTATTTFSPALIAIVAVLGSALLVVSYYKIFVKYCKASRWRPSFRRRRRSFDFEENIQVDAYSLEGFQDPEGWQIITHSYGLDEAVIRSIPLCRFTKAEKLIDSMECAVCLVEFQENEALRLLPKCSHAFHINCIDVWLRSHANCPLCRANIVYVESPFVPAMASRIRPSLEHGMAGVVHDSFRSEDSAAIGAYNAARSSAERMNNVDFQDIVDIGQQCTGLDLEAEGSEHADGLNTRSIILELGGDETIAGSKGDPIMENGTLSELLPTLSRSYSFGSSGNEHYNFTSRDSRTHLLDSLPVTDSTASPWRYRRTFRWSKRFSSPFNSKGRFSLNPRALKSPFFRRGSSSSTNFSSMFALSPARDYYNNSRRSMGDYRHAGLTRARGGSLSPPFIRVGRSESSTRFQSMTSPLFVKRSFSVLTSSRLRTGDPEALLSPDRFNRRD